MIFNRIPRNVKNTVTWTSGNSTLSAFDLYLKAYFPLGGLSASVGSFTLTNNTGVSFTTDGQYGKCASFADSHYLYTAHSSDLQVSSSQDWLISVWFNQTTTVSGGDNCILSMSDSYGYGVSIQTDGYRKVRLRVGSGGGYAINQVTGTYNYSEWNNYMLYYTEGHLYAYLNGTSVLSAEVVTISEDSNSPFYIGHDAFWGCSFIGFIDEIAIWKGTALSADARTALYNSGNGSFYKG